jgi:DNA modification methylase
MKLINSDCLVALKLMADSSVDSLITDPPAGISFMGKAWDEDKGGRKQWVAWMTEVMTECMRVLKPGAHGLVWAIPRTSHWTATALEDAGFEIRDVVTHIFGSGFPKSHNIEKVIGEAGKGIGTALKPASEHWVLVRKPISEKTVAANVLAHGTGGINIDASRITVDRSKEREYDKEAKSGITGDQGSSFGSAHARNDSWLSQGRFPANLVLSHNDDCHEVPTPYTLKDQPVNMKNCTPGCAVSALDEQSGSSKSSNHTRHNGKSENLSMSGANLGHISKGIEDSGGASRFFYVAKASKKDKNNGCEDLLTWENVDQELQTQMEGLKELLKDMSVDGVPSLKDSEWSTILSGSNTTEKFQKAFKFTMLTTLKMITELKTSNALVPLSIKENILDAIKMNETSGLNLAEAADFIKKSLKTTISEKTAIAMSVSAALLLGLSEIRKLAKEGNIHATVKSSSLMTYLIKLITPPGGIVLDPFMGSGSTGVAAIKEGFDFIGIEKEAEYFAICEKRVK